MPRRGSDSGRYAVIWLATAYTVFIGLAPIAVVIVVASENPQLEMLILAGVLGVIALWILIAHIPWDGTASRLKYWLLAQQRNDPTDVYRAARRRIRHREEYGTNEPPTVESVRDAANHGGAWVPKSHVERPRNKKSD